MALSDAKRTDLWLFLLIAFGWTWAFWVPFALQARAGVAIPAVVLPWLAEGRPAAWGPLIAALVVALRHDGAAGLRALLARMVRARFALRWYLVALGLLPALVGAAQLIAFAAGEVIAPSEALAAPLGIPIAFAWIFFFGGPLQEEAGWRGTLTASLQGRVGALGASLVTGLVWAAWHLPLFFIPREDIYYNQPIWGLTISTVLLSVLLTWVVNRTGHSLFAAMLMHTSWNWGNYLFTGLQTDTGGLAFLLLLGGVVGLVVLRGGPGAGTDGR